VKRRPRKPRETKAQRRRRVARLAPADVPREFFSMFGEMDPGKAKRVARFVDVEQRRSGYCQEVLLLEVGGQPGIGLSSPSRLKDYLRAGRYLLHEEEACRRRRPARA
jgi:hypothetical protein